MLVTAKVTLSPAWATVLERHRVRATDQASLRQADKRLASCALSVVIVGQSVQDNIVDEIDGAGSERDGGVHAPRGADRLEDRRRLRGG